MAFGFYDRMVVFDHVKKTMFVIATAHVNRHAGDAAAAYDEARHRVDAMVDRLTTSDSGPVLSRHRVPTAGMPTSPIAPISRRTNLKPRCGSASSTSEPATSSRW